jgi:hypothetical protein
LRWGIGEGEMMDLLEKALTILGTARGVLEDTVHRCGGVID